MTSWDNGNTLLSFKEARQKSFDAQVKDAYRDLFGRLNQNDLDERFLGYFDTPGEALRSYIEDNCHYGDIQYWSDVNELDYYIDFEGLAERVSNRPEYADDIADLLEKHDDIDPETDLEEFGRAIWEDMSLEAQDFDGLIDFEDAANDIGPTYFSHSGNFYFKDYEPSWH